MIRDYEIVDSENGVVRTIKDKQEHYDIKELFKHNLINFEIMPTGWGEYMSIKDNIKEELYKIVEQRENTCRKLYNQDGELMLDDEWHEGHFDAIADELIFLDRIKAFIKSL